MKRETTNYSDRNYFTVLHSFLRNETLKSIYFFLFHATARRSDSERFSWNNKKNKVFHKMKENWLRVCTMMRELPLENNADKDTFLRTCFWNDCIEGVLQKKNDYGKRNPNACTYPINGSDRQMVLASRVLHPLQQQVNRMMLHKAADAQIKQVNWHMVNFNVRYKLA